VSLVRSLVFFLWLVFWLIPFASGLVLTSLFVRGEPLYRWFAVPWLRSVLLGARWICGVRMQVTGTQHLKQALQADRVILVAKHQSALETLALPVLMPRPLSYVFKRELLAVPFFGWALARLNMVWIDRSKRSEAWARVARQGAELMDSGHWVIMFPEGTRVERGAIGAYKTGATRLAVSTNALLVPIAIASARCWPRRSFWLKPGVVDVSVGPPMRVDTDDPDVLMQRVQTWIEGEMRRIDASAYDVTQDVA
jgi:1-acyl-sn-glycerol-3-phosphate acyltransferase